MATIFIAQRRIGQKRVGSEPGPGKTPVPTTNGCAALPVAGNSLFTPCPVTKNVEYYSIGPSQICAARAHAFRYCVLMVVRNLVMSLS